MYFDYVDLPTKVALTYRNPSCNETPKAKQSFLIRDNIVDVPCSLLPSAVVVVVEVFDSGEYFISSMAVCIKKAKLRWRTACDEN
ncbi:Rhamnogalacturonate lyase family protein [Gossypium australe]|uniref:Rhamnogalacturonate lyase family protein n=1 Tax=Gossypium australe TaxID=47621 RepID=A0A5B6UAW5_9ROSI|nr:Rhamnogalacturonate lyase family protein [Gossypium australe]